MKPAVITLTLREQERFWAKVDRADDCWVWTSSLTDKGYPEFYFRGKTTRAHRLSYQVFREILSPGVQVDHTCHNHACVRPDHLRPATNKQNAENRAGARAGNVSGIRGVRYRPRSGTWAARICHNGRDMWLGTYSTPEEAELAVTAKRQELFTHA